MAVGIVFCQSQDRRFVSILFEGLSSYGTELPPGNFQSHSSIQIETLFAFLFFFFPRRWSHQNLVDDDDVVVVSSR